jgi:hypothetical protein
LEIISFILMVFGLGWLLLILTIAFLGGRFLIEIKNPFTKSMDSITDITIDHQNKKNPAD